MPLITGAGSLLGAIFAYFILPVWVAYILKDKTTLVATFDRSLPAAWRFDTWAVIKTVERDFGQWVRGQILLGFAVGIATFIGLIVLSNLVDPIFGRYARPAVGHRRAVRARADHRPDHLGRARGAAGGHRRPGRGARGAPPVLPRPAGREQLPRAQDPGRRRPAPPGRGRLRDHHRRVAGRAARGHPGAAGHGRLPRRRPLPVPAPRPRTSPTRSAIVARRTSGWAPTMPDRFDPYKILQVDSEAEDEVIQAAYRRLARKYHPDLAETPEAAARMSAINAAWELIGDPAARRRTTATRDAAARGRPRRRARHGAAPSASRPSTPPRRPLDRPAAAPPPPPDVVSRDWTSGRSTQGGGYDESMRAAEGHGAAGPPPGRPSGTRPQLRPLRRLVARRDRPARHRVHRMARPGADRPQLPRRRSTRSCGDRPARSAEAEAADRRGLYRRR